MAAIVHCSDGIAADERLLMGEVPDAVAPVLQAHEPQAGAGREDHFGRAAVQAAVGWRRGWPSRTSASLRPLLRARPACGRDRRRRRSAPTGSAAARSIDDAARHVQEMPARPAGGMQGGEFVVARIDGAGEEVLANQIAVRVDQLVEAAEEDAFARPTSRRAAMPAAGCRVRCVLPASSTPSVSSERTAASSPRPARRRSSGSAILVRA